MTGDMAFVLGVLAAAVVGFASGRLRLDAIALLVLLVLMLGGVVTVGEALAGFADPVVLMIGGLFVVGQGLVATGIAGAVGDWLIRIGGTGETRLILLLMVTVSLGGAFVSSTGIVAIFIPIVLSIALRTGIAKARLMMPLAFAALISGMMTLISTPPNLVVAAELESRGLESFGFFDFTPIGLTVMGLGLAYMLLIGRQLIGADDGAGDGPRAGLTIADYARRYGIADAGRRLRIERGSPLIGQTIGGLDLRARSGITVASVQRRQGLVQETLPALSGTRLEAGDMLLVLADPGPLQAFIAAQALTEWPFEARQRRDAIRQMGMAEVMLPPDSKIVGSTLREAALRSRHQVTVLAIRRDGAPLGGALVNEPLRFGDTLLISGRWRDIGALQGQTRDFVVLALPLESEDAVPAHRQAPWALGIVALMVVTMVAGLLPNVAVVMIAALAMVAARCLSGEDAYRSINWPSLVLIAGMLPLATALERTGGTDLLVGGLVGGLGDLGPLAMMAGLYALTAVLSMFISNTATALLLAPIAVGTAIDLGVAPAPMVMTVAIAASAAFMTPVSSPVNTLVMEPGGYRFVDFVRVGVPMTLLTGLVSLVLIPLLFPF